MSSRGPGRAVDTEPQGLAFVLQDITPSAGVPTRVNSLPALEPVDRLRDLQETRTARRRRWRRQRWRGVMTSISGIEMGASSTEGMGPGEHTGPL
eukprot:4497528-Pyramimonas_sp.AAC.1